MKEISLMNEFNIAVAESVIYKKYLKNIGNYKYYYSKEYGKRIKEYLKNLGVDSKEDSKESLRSTSSSARLCTNYFYNDDVEFEKPISNDVSNAKTKMDAVKGNIFYECKCQEIVNGEHEYLRQSYYTKKTSKLFKEFNIENIEIKQHYDAEGNADYKYCDFTLKDIGIDYSGKYYEINFNVKQLICHLIAIAHDYPGQNEKVLKYIIFKPKQELIEKSERLKKLYDTLELQFKAIIDSDNIKAYISENNHNIKIEKVNVYIDKVIEHFE